MTLIEFIGFIITMVAFFLLIGKQARDDRKRRREHPEEYEEELVSQQQQIEEILKTMGVQEEEEAPRKEKRAAKPPPPPPEDRMTTTEEDIEALDKRRAEAAAKVKETSPWLKSQEKLFVDVHKKGGKRESIHEDAYEKLARQQSRVRKSLAGLNSLKNAVILKEILGPPKGLKGDDYSS